MAQKKKSRKTVAKRKPVKKSPARKTVAKRKPVKKSPARKTVAKRKPVKKKKAAKKGSARSTLRPGGSSASPLTAPLESPRFVPPPSWNAAGTSRRVPPTPPEPIQHPVPTVGVSSSAFPTRPLRSPAPTPSPATPVGESLTPKIVTASARSERSRSQTNFKIFTSRMRERSIPVGAFVVSVVAAVILLIIVLTTGGGAGGLLANSGSKPAVSATEIQTLGRQMTECDQTLSVLQGLAKRSATAGGTPSADELLATDSSLESTCGQLRASINRLVTASK